MNKYFIIALGVGLSTLTSCHLDVAPTSYVEAADANNAIKTDLELVAMRNGIYSSFRSTFYGVNSQPSEVMCDGFNAAIGYGNNYGGIHRTDMTFTSSDYDTKDLWESMYSAIKDYNIFINSAQNYGNANAASKAAADLYAGEALCFRAYSYMELVRHFAKAYNTATASSDLGVPLVLAYNQLEKPHRATVAKVYEQIKADLDLAASYGIADKPGAKRSEWVTSDVLNMLYARYYLDTKNNEKAAEYAEKVINSAAEYVVSSNADDMKAEYTNDNGTEAIMQLPASITENGSGTNDYYTKASNNPKLVSLGFPGKGIYLAPYFLPSGKLIDSYTESDLRLNQWFTKNYYVIEVGGKKFKDIYAFSKYLGNPALRSSSVPNARQHVKPFMIGEAYLIAAEAYFKGGDAEKAKIALNALQSARVAEVTEATEENIENEWFRETVGEGLRISCLKRWGKGYTARYAQPAVDEKNACLKGDYYEKRAMAADDIHWVWPIPAYEIKVNQNLENEQNPGY